MSMQYKRRYGVYSAWNYGKEIEDLNRASDEGWQLVRGGCFSSKFVKNPDVRYRYQLDYGKIEDMGRYIETFREQGWEYVNSIFNGWHYFRKLYDPSRPAEEYEIFTDRESLQEMNRRWARLALVIAASVGVLALIWTVWMLWRPSLPVLIQLLMFASESAILLYGSRIMYSPDGKRSRRGDGVLLAAFLAVIILGCTASITLRMTRPATVTSQQTDSIEEPVVDSRWADFTVRYPDFYYLDLEMEAEEPMTFSVLSESGEVVYTETGTSFHRDGIRLRLPRGEYCFSISCTTGFRVACGLH